MLMLFNHKFIQIDLIFIILWDIQIVKNCKAETRNLGLSTEITINPYFHETKVYKILITDHHTDSMHDHLQDPDKYYGSEKT